MTRSGRLRVKLRSTDSHEPVHLTSRRVLPLVPSVPRRGRLTAGSAQSDLSSPRATSETKATDGLTLRHQLLGAAPSELRDVSQSRTASYRLGVLPKQE